MSLKKPHIGRKTAGRQRFGGGLNAHWRVAKVAVQMAREMFEVYMVANNEMYRKLRENFSEKEVRDIFVMKVAPQLYEDARRAMAMCLKLPEHEFPAAEKEKIMEALVLDSDLRANRPVAAANATIPRGVAIH
jgi:hypothetical protein